MLVQERRWDNWAVFAGHLERTARDLALKNDSPRFSGVFIARRTFDRWMLGDLRAIPQQDTRVAVEHLLGFPFDELFGPPRDVPREADIRGDRGEPGAERSGAALADPQSQRAAQYDTAMPAFDERPGG
ncbi:hypothetical protein [Streptomyces sp. NBC_00239]|uniref:hypothetical protein n=1 Tax=Streptomyces sp. NBC_00239 TaxID=2903640 RepID=UPI002E298BE2|nr:hypothetical protein [Streptomyces sp. NBC_00239]